jgi:hypothetical protein
VEDALAELVRNSLDAEATSVFVASSLKARRYRTLTVIDDGRGIPSGFEDRIFEPGITSRHLDPVPAHTELGHRTHASEVPQGAGLSLYHIKRMAISASVLSRAAPTSIRAVFDTGEVPERALQTLPTARTSAISSTSPRRSRSNLPARLGALIPTREAQALPAIYYSSPSRILATLHHAHIIQADRGVGLYEDTRRLGLDVSLRTVQRVLSGSVRPARRLGGEEDHTVPEKGLRRSLTATGEARRESSGATLYLGEREIRGIQAILEGAARASYLEIGPLRAEAREGGIVLRASVYEPEEMYDD